MAGVMMTKTCFNGSIWRDLKSLGYLRQRYKLLTEKQPWLLYLPLLAI